MTAPESTAAPDAPVIGLQAYTPPQDIVAGFSGPWTWRTQAPPPGNGEARADTSGAQSAGLIAIETTDSTTTDRTTDLSTVAIGQTLVLSNASNDNQWTSFVVSSITSYSTYFSFSTSNTTFSGADFGNNATLVITQYVATTDHNSYTVILTDQEEQALIYVAGDTDPATYLSDRVHEMCSNYINTYNVNNAPAPPVDVASAYIAATPDQQQQVLDILGVPVGGTP